MKRSEIANLRCQHPTFLYLSEEGETLFRYTADFSYEEVGNPVPIIEDFKGTMTREFRRTKKLIEARFKITIRVVTKKDLAGYYTLAAQMRDMGIG